jgi:hypothetical protein
MPFLRTEASPAGALDVRGAGEQRRVEVRSDADMPQRTMLEPGHVRNELVRGRDLDGVIDHEDRHVGRRAVEAEP